MKGDPQHQGSSGVGTWLPIVSAIVFIAGGVVSLLLGVFEIKPKVAEYLNPAAVQAAREAQRADSLGRVTRERALADAVWLDSVQANLPTDVRHYQVVLQSTCRTTASVALRYRLAGHGYDVTYGWWNVDSSASDTTNVRATGGTIAYHVSFESNAEWSGPVGGEREVWEVLHRHRFANLGRIIFEGSGVSRETFVRVPMGRYAIGRTVTLPVCNPPPKFKFDTSFKFNTNQFDWSKYLDSLSKAKK
jgi:hypothetical protein